MTEMKIAIMIITVRTDNMHLTGFFFGVVLMLFDGLVGLASWLYYSMR